MLMHSNGIIEDMRKHDKLTNNKEMMSWLDMNASILHTGFTEQEILSLAETSNKELCWQCPHDNRHAFARSAYSQYNAKYKCPICMGILIIAGVNDIATIRPDVAAMMIDKNLARTKGVGSHERTEFKCLQNPTHPHWNEAIREIVNGHGCPECFNEKRKYIRRAKTKEESIGYAHPEIITGWSDKNDGTPFDYRISSSKKIILSCVQCNHEYKVIISNITDGHRQYPELCLQCSQERITYERNHSIKENNIAVEYPWTIDEWDDKGNDDYTPFMFTAGSTFKANWKCINDKRHGTYIATIEDRIGRKRGCPYCSHNRVLPGVTDLQTNHPEIAAQWNPVKNNGDLPINEACTSHNMRTWTCDECGQDWQSTVANRVYKHSGCPNCNRMKRAWQNGINECVERMAGRKMLMERRILDIGNDRNAEIDIYDEQTKTGIEANGLIWHSSRFMADTMRHQKKYLNACEQGIKLIMCWADDYDEYPDAIMDLIRRCMNIAGIKSHGTTRMEQLTDEHIDFMHENSLFHESALGGYNAITTRNDDNEIIACMISRNNMIIGYTEKNYHDSNAFDESIELLKQSYDVIHATTVNGESWETPFERTGFKRTRICSPRRMTLLKSKRIAYDSASSLPYVDDAGTTEWLLKNN